MGRYIGQVSVYRLCLPVSEIKSDQYFILCLFTTSVCIRLCLPVSEINQINVFYLCFNREVLC